MKAITEQEFRKLTKYIKAHFGVNLLHKKTLVVGRLQNYLLQHDFKSFSDYYEFVVSDETGKAAAALINKVTTNHTFFMREADHFAFFKDHVLPGLAVTAQGEKDLRVWSAGCSTGEEPYALAMIMADHFAQERGRWDTRVLATDISTKVLEEAESGIYPTEKLSSLPAKWRKQNFIQLDKDRSQVIQQIRKEVIFRRFNLMERVFPFKKKFHVIFCRNVMIYFDRETRGQLVDKFYECTEPGGYFFIGHSESLNRGEMKFRYVSPAIYRKD